MRTDVLEILNKHNIKLQLKGYKEMPSTDGYHMTGNLYINGKKAIHFQDLGIGGAVKLIS